MTASSPHLLELAPSTQQQPKASRPMDSRRRWRGGSLSPQDDSATVVEDSCAGDHSSIATAVGGSMFQRAHIIPITLTADLTASTCPAISSHTPCSMVRSSSSISLEGRSTELDPDSLPIEVASPDVIDVGERPTLGVVAISDSPVIARSWRSSGSTARPVTVRRLSNVTAGADAALDSEVIVHVVEVATPLDESRSHEHEPCEASSAAPTIPDCGSDAATCSIDENLTAETMVVSSLCLQQRQNVTTEDGCSATLELRTPPRRAARNQASPALPPSPRTCERNLEDLKDADLLAKVPDVGDDALLRLLVNDPAAEIDPEGSALQVSLLAAEAQKALTRPPAHDAGPAMGVPLEDEATGDTAYSSTLHVADATSEEHVRWQLGRVDAPLEKLMFGESPRQHAVPLGAVLEELLESPSPSQRRRVEALRAARSALDGCEDLSEPMGCHRVANHRIAAWFEIHARGASAEAVLLRAPEDHEETFAACLVRALAATRPRRKRGRGRTAEMMGAASEVFSAFQQCLGAEVTVESLRCVPMNGELARALPPELGDPAVSATRLPPRPNMLTGETLRRAKSSVEELLRLSGVTVFKIGITCNPLMRWRAYERDGYESLHLLYADEQERAVMMMEAALIDTFGSRAGCRNVARGGEGPVGRGPYFTYLALAPCTSHLVGTGCRKRARHN